MGVYTQLCTPIFNYIDMAQIIEKFQEGGNTPKQPNLYKRGNDNIDRDAYIRAAENEFDIWLEDSRLKDKQKAEVKAAFQDILSGINDGSFEYKIGGGYNNTRGITNAKKGFDAYGLAAGFLGSVLRKQQAYVAPADPSKIKYSGVSSIGRKFLKDVLGEAGNVDYFVKKDPRVDGKRGHANRIKIIQDFLDNLYNNDDWGNYFTEFSDDQKNQWRKEYERYGKNIDRNGNGIIDESEYLEISRLLGLDNLETLLSSDEEELNTPVDTPVDTSTGNTPTKTTSSEVTSTKAPLRPIWQLIDNNKYGTWSAKTLESNLKALDDKQLIEYLETAYKTKDRSLKLYNLPQIQVSINGKPLPFTNSYILRSIMTILMERGSISKKKKASTGNYYYIPYTYSGKIGTVLAYDIENDGIKEMYATDFPYVQEQLKKIQSSKNGGVLKFQGGGPFWYSDLTDYNPDLYIADYDTSTLVDGDMSDDKFILWASPNAGLGQGRYQSTEGYGEMGIDKEHYQKAQGIENQNYYRRFGEDLLDENGNFTKLGEAWAREVDKLLPKGSLATFYDENGNLRTSWTPQDLDSHGREQKTYTSLKEYVNAIRNDQIIAARHNVFLKKGKRYFYKDKDGKEHWVAPSVASKYKSMKVRSGWNTDRTTYWDDYQIGGPEEDLDKTPLDEKALGSQKNNSLGNILTNLTPDILGAGRLMASLQTNNKVAKTVREHLKPVLKNTYELYSPVTGAYDKMQLASRHGWNIMANARKPFTSDAQLNTARMLEGQRQANNIQSQAFLEDSAEIRRTAGEARIKQEDNIKRRSDTANWNGESINKTERELAQLEATRLKSNWSSWDNFMQGIEKRLRDRVEENKTRFNNLHDKVIQQKAMKLVSDYQEQALRSFYAWQNYTDDNGNQPNKNKDITEWGVNENLYAQYKKGLEEAQARANDMIWADSATRYNIPYQRLYSDGGTKLFFDRGWQW